MKINFEVDSRGLLTKLGNGKKALIRAQIRAVNNTAVRVQKAEFLRIDEVFEIRDRRFLFGTPERPGGVAARITFASEKKGRPYAEVEIARASTLKSQRRLLLPIYEAGGERKPGHSSAVPITGSAARPSMTAKVTPEFTFGRLALKAFRGRRKVTVERRGKGGKVRRAQVGLFGEFGRLEPGRAKAGSGIQFKGRQRSFLLPRSRGYPGGAVFRRTGPGRGDIETLWSFRRGIVLQAELAWVPTALTTARAWFREEMARQVAVELARDRGRSL